MTNPQTTYAAMREALDSLISESEMFLSRFGTHEECHLLQAIEIAKGALALPEPSEPDPAQELLASVVLNRLKNNTADFLDSSEFPTPNKADAEALVKIMKWLHEDQTDSNYDTGVLLQEAYEAATPLIKQIARGG